MNTPTKLGALTLGVAIVFGLAFGAGQVAGPIGPGAAFEQLDLRTAAQG